MTLISIDSGFVASNILALLKEPRNNTFLLSGVHAGRICLYKRHILAIWCPRWYNLFVSFSETRHIFVQTSQGLGLKTGAYGQPFVRRSSAMVLQQLLEPRRDACADAQRLAYGLELKSILPRLGMG